VTATEIRLARLAWATVVGMGVVYAYAIVAPKYMGFYQPTLLERAEFPAVALTGLVFAATTYLVTREPRILRFVAVVVSILAAWLVLALIWPRVVDFVRG
jgi:hypothetical protein